MGIIKRGILGGFSGKVANVKSLPLSVANPRTAQQVENRNAMSFASRIGSQLLSGIIIPLNNRFAGNISGYNAFVQRFKNANPTAPAGITQLPISEGKMLAPASASLSIMSGVPTLSWTNPTGDAFALPTDKVYYAIANWTSDGKEIVTYCGYTGVTRADQPSVVLTLDDYDFLDAGRRLRSIIVKNGIHNDSPVKPELPTVNAEQPESDIPGQKTRSSGAFS